MATIAVSALLALSGAAQWQALYAQTRNAPAKNIMGCVQSAQDASTVQSIKETSGMCAGDAGK